MRNAGTLFLVASLVAASVAPDTLAAPDPSLIRIRIVAGEGSSYRTGSRGPGAIVVEVTDEAGEPVKDAAVSFRLPGAGPSGVFPNGLTSDLVLTDADGIAAAPRVRWNTLPGPVQIRITAAKDNARAGIVVNARLSEDEDDAEAKQDLAALKSRRDWLKVVAIVAGVTAGSTVAGLALIRRASAGQAAAAPATVTIGPPVITIGGPQ